MAIRHARDNSEISNLLATLIFGDQSRRLEVCTALESLSALLEREPRIDLLSTNRDCQLKIIAAACGLDLGEAMITYRKIIARENIDSRTATILKLVREIGGEAKNRGEEKSAHRIRRETATRGDSLSMTRREHEIDILREANSLTHDMFSHI